MARGSIEKRLGANSKPTWTARWSYLDPLSGERKYKRSSHPTKKAAEAVLANALDVGATMSGDSRITRRTASIST
jgi:hypothetical protein